MFFARRIQLHCLAALLAMAAITLTAQTVSAAELLVDRGLTDTGTNDSNISTRTNWSSGFIDPKEGGGLDGDDFTLPTEAATYHIANIRIFMADYFPYGATLTPADMFNSIDLLLGTSTSSPLASLGVAPTVTQVTYPNGQNYGSHLVNIYALDYATDINAAGGTKFYFAALPDAKAIPGGPGPSGETYYESFLHSTAVGALTGYNSGADGVLLHFVANGTYVDTWSTTDGGIVATDLNVQVTGTAPEPVTLSMLALGGLAMLKRRRGLGR